MLPLTWMRHRTNFFINESKYEEAVKYIRSKELNNAQLVVLPKQYEYLSDGKVLVINSQNKRAVLFYTFRGIPDGFGGFLKIDKQQNIDSLYNSQNYTIRNIGNNWYHISGE